MDTFYTNVSLWSATAWFFAKPKKWLWSIQMLISCNLHGRNFWNFSTSFQTNVLQDPTITCAKKRFFIKFGTCTRNGSFGAFLVRI